MRQLLLSLAAAMLMCLCSQSALATANYVYHEQTGNPVANPDRDAPASQCAPNPAKGVYVSNTDRVGSLGDGFQIYSPESYTLRFKVEYQFFTTQVRVYYTTDGSTPAGSFGTPSGTTQVVTASYTNTYRDCGQSDQTVDIVTATIPAQPAGTTVKYIVSAWHEGGGEEVFGNSAGPGCVNCGFSCTTSGCATQFSYTVVAAPSTPLIISEFRLFGPSGSTDEFIEIYNNSDAEVTVNAFDGSAGFAVVSSDGTTRFTIPNNTPIPARGHFLAAHQTGYTLAAYPAGTSRAATADVPYNSDIPANAGLALFNTADPAKFTSDNRLDAVGSASVSNPLYKEGTGYPVLNTFSVEHSLYRDLKSGTPKDTGNNEADFLLVSTDGVPPGMCTSTANFKCQRLGAPGPENLSSPTQRNSTIKSSLIDPGCTGFTTSGTGQPTNNRDTTCARHRDATADSANNSDFGTLSIRRRFTNTTGANLTKLRFRIIDLTTFPDGASGNGLAWLVARSSADYTATCVGTGGGCTAPGATVIIRGTTLETPPTQPNGGGFNSTLAAGTITLTNKLINGDSINLQFLLGVQSNGAYRFFLNVEALTDAVPAASERMSPTKSDTSKAAARALRGK
ncbi:MAG TPA: lamin tail domain-containing protein [Pyrinomonadaceae bacterium]|jgi:hypothetical protein